MPLTIVPAMPGLFYAPGKHYIHNPQLHNLMNNVFQQTVIINAPASHVWRLLTHPSLMTTWMGEAEMNLHRATTWAVNSPIVITGFHHLPFENKGIILKYEQERQLTYTHMNSLSRLSDISENYTVLDFVLEKEGGQTMLTLHMANFPTETIFKHLQFYWRTTLVKIKNAAEKERQ